MSGTTIPIAIWPWPQPPEQLERIRLAYLQIAPGFPVQPVQAYPGEPGGRVLGMGAIPPFAVDTAYVKNPADDTQILEKLRLYLLAPEGAEGFFSTVDWLNVFLGPGVTEVGVERAPQRVAFQ